MVQLLPLRRRGVTRFFTLSLADASATTLVDEIVHLRAAVRSVLQRSPFEIDAWVVMPDHLHAVLTVPQSESDFTALWAAIRDRFSTGLSDAALTPGQRSIGTAGLWHPCLDEQAIEDRADLEAYRRHCWMDPVRHGFVAAAGDWPYSSFHREVAHRHRDMQAGCDLACVSARDPAVETAAT